MSDDFIKKALGMGLDSEGDDAKALVPYTPEQEIIQPLDEKIEQDFDFVRDNTIELIAQSSEAIAELLLIAKQSQHPRAFEVIANLLKTSSDLNSDLVALHKKKNDLQPKDQSPASSSKQGTVNNNLFVGSTAEFQKMLAEMKKSNGDK